MNVTATRMELSKYRKRLKTSEEAYKLLKDKQDDLMRRFIALIKETDTLRKEINASIRHLSTQTGLGIAGLPHQMVDNLTLAKESAVMAQIDVVNVMGVNVIDVSYTVKETRPSSALVSTPLLAKTGHEMRSLLPGLLRLTVTEKNCYILAKEIEVLRRRVNALEHLIIPELRRDIRIIRLKLSDNERETISRLIKTKSLTSSSVENAVARDATNDSV